MNAEIFNKNLTTEITSVLLKSNPQRGTAVTNHITAMERKLAELELRICTSTALGSSDSEEVGKRGSVFDEAEHRLCET